MLKRVIIGGSSEIPGWITLNADPSTNPDILSDICELKNIEDNSVSVFRNKASSGAISSSSFDAKVEFSTGNTPSDIAIADLDLDGKVDMVVSDFTDNTISVYRNISSSGSISSSSFDSRVSFSTNTNPYSISLADVDGDGKLDISVANRYGTSVSVFRNNSSSGSFSTSSFSAAVDFSTGSGSEPHKLVHADVDGDVLDAIWRRVIDRTFNCVSVDTDTSTSDTAIVLASGAAGAVNLAELEAALEHVTQSLTKQVARDGEGAETLIEVCVDQARDSEQAKTVAKAIVNSPLVKTAVHGADPNWGRVAMAVGKCSQYTDINQDKVIIRFGNQEVYPVAVDESGLKQLSEYMRGDEVRIHVSLHTGQATSTVWGCDLTDGYVRINADYTT